MKRVLGIVYEHENNALAWGSNDYCKILGYKNYRAEIANVALPEGVAKLDAWLKTGEVEFCFGIQGVGSNLTRGEINLWTHAKVPFICLHYDNPCYNFYNHDNDSPYITNIYFSEYFCDIKQRYIGGTRTSSVHPYQMTGYIHESNIPYANRPIKLCYLKTGGSTAEYTDYFDSLPPKLRDGVYDIIWQGEADPDLHICDLVDRLLVKEGYERRKYITQFWAVVQSIDFYIRRKRAINFVNWLKFQPGAVIVGDGWGFIDKEDIKAEFRPALSGEKAFALYDQSKVICNTNPYGRDLVHERVVSGLAKQTCVITDTNQWWDSSFPHISALKTFRWNESLDDQLRPWLQSDSELNERYHPARDSALAAFWKQDNVDKMIETAKIVAENAVQ